MAERLSHLIGPLVLSSLTKAPRLLYHQIVDYLFCLICGERQKWLDSRLAWADEVKAAAVEAADLADINV